MEVRSRTCGIIQASFSPSPSQAGCQGHWEVILEDICQQDQTCNFDYVYDDPNDSTCDTGATLRYFCNDTSNCPLNDYCYNPGGCPY
jgi:hypothetical protein